MAVFAEADATWTMAPSSILRANSWVRLMGSFKVDVDDVVPLLLGDVEDGLAGDVARRVDPTSMSPKVSRTASRRSTRSSRTVTSQVTSMVSAPRSLSSAAVRSTRSSDREVATTSAPSSAKPSAMARPIPLVAPTATTVLPSAPIGLWV